MWAQGLGNLSVVLFWFCCFCFVWWDLHYVNTFAKSNVKNITLPRMHHVSVFCVLWADVHYKIHSNFWTWQIAFQAALTRRPWSSVGPAIEWTAIGWACEPCVGYSFAKLSLEYTAGPFSLWCTMNNRRPSDYWLCIDGYPTGFAKVATMLILRQFRWKLVVSFLSHKRRCRTQTHSLRAGLWVNYCPLLSWSLR